VGRHFVERDFVRLMEFGAYKAVTSPLSKLYPNREEKTLSKKLFSGEIWCLCRAVASPKTYPTSGKMRIIGKTFWRFSVCVVMFVVVEQLPSSEWCF